MPKAKTVYMVQNGDGIIMAVCLTKRRAKSIVKNVGNVRWHEAWRIIPIVLDEVDPAMMGGSESYQRMLKQMEALNAKG